MARVFMKKDKLIEVSILAVSALIFVVVMALFSLPKAETMPAWATHLPAVNASLSFTCALCLVVSGLAIKRGNVALHKKMNFSAFAVTTLFLISYVTFHAVGVETHYPVDHPWRPVYLTILTTHIILAATVLPLALFSFYWALAGKFDLHRRIVKFSYPIWLYVSTTGVVVYLMISPYYPF